MHPDYLHLQCLTCGQRAPYCDLCFAQRVYWYGSQAQHTGWLWGRAVARVANGAWPEYDDPAAEKLRAIARRKVADLASGDERLWDVLARKCAQGAAKGYAENS